MSSVISLSTHQFFKTESQKPVLFAVFSFLEQFFSSSTVVSIAKANVLQMPTIAVFARNWSGWSGADPKFAPFRWRIWLALSEFLCLLDNQTVTFVTLFWTKLPFFLPLFWTVLPKNCISLSQSQSRNFFIFIIKFVMTIKWFANVTFQARSNVLKQFAKFIIHCKLCGVYRKSAIKLKLNIWSCDCCNLYLLRVRVFIVFWCIFGHETLVKVLLKSFLFQCFCYQSYVQPKWTKWVDRNVRDYSITVMLLC